MAKRKQQNNSAFRPNLVEQYREIGRLKRKKQAEERDLHDDDAALYELSVTDGWQILTEYIGALKDGMKHMVDASIEQGADFDDIGKRTLISKLASEKLDQIIERVNGAIEVYEASGPRKP